MENTFEYTLYEDGFYYPNLTLKENNIILGRWGRMRYKYLEKHRRVLFAKLLTTDTIHQHCKEIEDSATEQMEIIIEQMKRVQGVTEQLKSDDQMQWVGRMNNIRNQAEEIVIREIIYG